MIKKRTNCLLLSHQNNFMKFNAAKLLKGLAVMCLSFQYIASGTEKKVTRFISLSLAFMSSKTRHAFIRHPNSEALGTRVA